MAGALRAHLLSGVVGGLVVAGVFLAVGVTGRRTVRTVIAQSPVAARSDSEGDLTPHAIYVRDAPGVVFVQSQVTQPVDDPFSLRPRGGTGRTSGSGFLVDRSGDILTAFHVVAGADRRRGVMVRFAGALSRSAPVVAEDPDDDLALLKVDMRGMPPVRPLPLGDSSTVRVGDPTLAIGNPFGLERTLTQGIVSALQRRIQAADGRGIDNVIQTDAPLNPSSAGGPVLDAAGRVIGISSEIRAPSGYGRFGVGFAVPVDTARELLPSRTRGS